MKKFRRFIFTILFCFSWIDYTIISEILTVTKKSQNQGRNQTHKDVIVSNINRTIRIRSIATCLIKLQPYKLGSFRYERNANNRNNSNNNNMCGERLRIRCGYIGFENIPDAI